MRASNARTLTRPLFTDQDFIPTKFRTAADKARFANTLLRFIESDCQQTLWTRRLYRRLSLCFGHIAHGDAGGF